MKKLLVTVFLAFLCSACASTSGAGETAKLPEGYKIAPQVSQEAASFIRESDQAMVMMYNLPEGMDSAMSVAEFMSENANCDAPSGNSSKATLKNCDMDGEKMNVTIYSVDGKQVFFASTDKVSSADIDAFADVLVYHK